MVNTSRFINLRFSIVLKLCVTAVLTYMIFTHDNVIFNERYMYVLLWYPKVFFLYSNLS